MDNAIEAILDSRNAFTRDWVETAIDRCEDASTWWNGGREEFWDELEDAFIIQRDSQRVETEAALKEASHE